MADSAVNSGFVTGWVKRARRPSLLLAAVIAVLLLLIAFHGANWPAMVATVRHADLRLVALCGALLCVSYALRAERWRVLLSAEKIVARRTVVSATMAGYLGNNFLPARAGELLRTVLLARRAGMSKSFVLATAFMERILDALALVIITVVVLLTLGGLPPWLLAGLRVTAAAATVGVLMIFVLPRFDRQATRLIGRLPVRPSLHVRLAGLLSQFLLGMRALNHVSRAIAFVALTAAIWLLDAVFAINVAHSLHLALGLSTALLLLATLGLASAAPSTPGYVGVYQFVALVVLVPFGYARSDALVYIVTFQAISYAVVAIGGVPGLLWLSRGPGVASSGSVGPHATGVRHSDGRPYRPAPSEPPGTLP